VAALVTATAALPTPGHAATNSFTATSVGTIGHHGHAGLYAWGAATLPDGSVLIGDYWNLRIMHYAKDGTLLSPLRTGWVSTTAPAFARRYTPFGMAVDALNGWVYVADTNNSRVERYDVNGNYLATFGSHGSGPGQFEYNSRVAIASNGDVYVSDAYLNKIEVWVPQSGMPPTAPPLYSSLLGGTKGSAVGDFNQPLGIAIDATDRLWVVDALNYRVQVYDGTSWTAFGSQAPSGLFHSNLRGIAIDKTNGWAYVVDGAANVVDKFDMTFAFLGTIGTQGTGPGQFSAGGREVTVDGDSNVWVADMPDFSAYKFAPTTSPTYTYILEVPNPPVLPPAGGFNGPRGVAFDSAGDAWVTDTYNQRIVEFDPTGKFLAEWGSRGQGPFAFNYPRAIAVNQTTGDITVADTDNNQVKDYYWVSGVLTMRWQRGGFATPYGLDIAPGTGVVYVTDSGHGVVVELEPIHGKPITSWGSGQFTQLQGIDVASDGSVWTTDQGTCLVQHFSSAGAPQGSPFGGCGTGSTQFKRPYGIESDGTYVYVADDPTDTVKVWTVGGAYVAAFGSPGGKPGQLKGPQGVDFGPNGVLYVVEQGNDRVQEFTITTG
jgi:DNA-binding beta-propeller fold protein YncE